MTLLTWFLYTVGFGLVGVVVNGLGYAQAAKAHEVASEEE